MKTKKAERVALIEEFNKTHYPVLDEDDFVKCFDLRTKKIELFTRETADLSRNDTISLEEAYKLADEFKG